MHIWGQRFLWKLVKFFIERSWPETCPKHLKWCCWRKLRYFKSFRRKKNFFYFLDFLNFFAYFFSEICCEIWRSSFLRFFDLKLVQFFWNGVADFFLIYFELFSNFLKTFDFLIFSEFFDFFWFFFHICSQRFLSIFFNLFEFVWDFLFFFNFFEFFEFFLLILFEFILNLCSRNFLNFFYFHLNFFEFFWISGVRDFCQFFDHLFLFL